MVLADFIFVQSFLSKPAKLPPYQKNGFCCLPEYLKRQAFETVIKLRLSGHFGKDESMDNN